MKKYIKYFVLINVLLLIQPWLLKAGDIPEKPEPARFVNDFAGILGAQEQQALEAKLKGYSDSTSTQIAVVIVTSLNGYDVADFSYRLAESWGIGQKGKNNGLLILIAPNERKMRIEVGYGLEAVVPDAKAKWIIDEIMKPNFKANNYYAGIDGAIDALINKASGEYKRDGTETDYRKKGSSGMSWVVVIVIIIFIIISMFNKGGRNGTTRYSSGGMFLGGGGFGRGSGGGGGGFGFGGGSFGGGGAGGDW